MAPRALGPAAVFLVLVPEQRECSRRKKHAEDTPSSRRSDCDDAAAGPVAMYESVRVCKFIFGGASLRRSLPGPDQAQSSTVRIRPELTDL